MLNAVSILFGTSMTISVIFVMCYNKCVQCIDTSHLHDIEITSTMYEKGSLVGNYELQ